MSGKMGVIDGKDFLSEFGQKGKNAEGKDELIFKDCRFRSTACDPYGFGDGDYTALVNGDDTTFEAETFSVNEGKIKWSGKIKGNVLDGTFTWHKPGKWYRVSKAPVEYWIRGQLKRS
jgi:hypothetical protein